MGEAKYCVIESAAVRLVRDVFICRQGRLGFGFRDVLVFSSVPHAELCLDQVM